jgi:protein SERAC1
MIANQGMPELGLIEIKGCENPNHIGDVIFVHGLLGHPITTWHPQEKNNQNCWPFWLGRDRQDLGIWSYGYNAQAFQNKRLGNPLCIYAEGINFLDALTNRGIIHPSRPLIFITYSLGGLLVKNMFRTAQTNNNNLVIQQPKGIVFLGTPHTNNALANLIDNFYILNGISKWFEFWKRPSNVLQELRNQQDRLSELNRWYFSTVNKNELNIKTKIYYETEKLNGVLVVDGDMAEPGINGVTPIPAVGKNHQTLAKPMRDDDSVYDGVLAFIDEVLKSSQLPSYSPPQTPNKRSLNSPHPDNIGRMNYEIGLQRLKEALPEEAIDEFNIYKIRLIENLDKKKLYGDGETLRNTRYEILDHLNKLARQYLKRSFNDLC